MTEIYCNFKPEYNIYIDNSILLFKSQCKSLPREDKSQRLLKPDVYFLRFRYQSDSSAEGWMFTVLYINWFL